MLSVANNSNLDLSQQNAVVYRAHGIAALGAIRSLGLVGVPVIGLNDLQGPAQFSRYCSSSLSCPDPLRSPRDFLNFLIGLGQQFDHRPVLYMMNDPHVVLASVNKHLLSKSYRMSIPGWPVLRRCIDKRLTYQYAEKAGVQVPITYDPQNDDIKHIAPHVPYPCIIKPVSHFQSDGNVISTEAFVDSYGAKAIPAYNTNELISLYGNAKRQGFDVLIQEIIPGPPSNLYTVGVYANRRSRILASFTGRKLRQIPREFGDCSIGESIQNEELSEIARELISKTEYHGIAQVEFKLDPRDSRYKLMEINPRLWSWNFLPTLCGVNLAHVAYQDLTGNSLPNTEQSAEQKLFATIWWDGLTLSKRGIRGILDCKTGHKFWMLVLIKKSCFGIFSLNDLSPTFYFLKKGLEAFFRKFKGLFRKNDL